MVKVRKQWHILLVVKILALNFGQHLVRKLRGLAFLLLEVVNGTQARFEDDVNLVCRKLLDLEVLKLRVDAQCQVGWEGPRGCRPREKADFRLIDEQAAVKL